MSRYFAEIYLFLTISILILTLFILKPALLPFFIAMALSYVSWPVYLFFERNTKGRKTISAILTILTLFLILFIAIFVILPTVITQVQSFINYLPTLGKKLDYFFYKYFGQHFSKKLHFNSETLQLVIKEVYQRLGNLPIGNLVSRFFSGVFSVISIVINIVVIPFLTYYFLTNADKLVRLYIALAPKKIQYELKELLQKVHDSLSSYLIGQLAVAVFVGFYIAFGLYLVGIKYAFLIGFIAGALNMIPYVGFFSGFIPSLLLGIFDNGTLGAVIGVVIVFLTEAGLENLIYPVIMSRTTGVNPLLILFSLFVGGYLGGFLGIIISVPLAVTLVPIFESFLKKKESGVACGDNG
ncbi:MAG: AI-2E family transporter [Desulfurobacteriaceae bacterium]